MPGNELQTQLEEKVDILDVELRALTDQLTTNETLKLEYQLDEEDEFGRALWETYNHKDEIDRDLWETL